MFAPQANEVRVHNRYWDLRGERVVGKVAPLSPRACSCTVTSSSGQSRKKPPFTKDGPERTVRECGLAVSDFLDISFHRVLKPWFYLLPAAHASCDIAEVDYLVVLLLSDENAATI